ncbi:hypothetical protein EON81_12875 [bacterium]|nr:MAG: hypothetical protein EON81_12875 [bacterium]
MNRWPHAPVHLLEAPGAYMVTAGTYGKPRLFNSPEKLTLLESALLEYAEEFGWRLQAWAVFENHCHFIGITPETAANLSDYLGKLHACTARDLNKLDGASGRKVWHQSWDSHRSHSKSYLARLAYVHLNPVRHGLAPTAEQYPWCSAEWFRQKASSAFVDTVYSFKTDRINAYDDF